MKATNSTTFIVLVLVIFNFQCVPPEDNWPQFRGPNSSGVSDTEQDPPINFGPAENVLLKIELPPGHSSPTIWGNYIFLTSFTEDDMVFKTLCFNRKNGNLLWSQDVSVNEIEKKIHAISNPANATVATDGERIYAYFGSYGIICYDFNGKKIWDNPMPIPETRHGMGTSPIVTNGMVILNFCNDSNGPNLLALDCINGNIVWKTDLPNTPSIFSPDGYSTPVVWENEIIIYRCGAIESYNIEDGSLIWWVTTNTDGVSTPVIGNNVLYVGTFSAVGDPEKHVDTPDYSGLLNEYDMNNDKKITEDEFPQDFIYVIRGDMGEEFLVNWNMVRDANKDGILDSIEWEKRRNFALSYIAIHGLLAIKPGGKGDISSTHVVWKVIKGVAEVPSPVYYDDHVYMIKNGGVISCVNAEDGTLDYHERLGASGPYISSPIAAGGKVFVVSRNGKITVLESGSEFKILAKNDLDEIIMATPAVVDNKLYVRTSEHLYAFGK
ncbi:PQQ-binding-like beta-propeller repeat protein [Bacteroidota bacterium]